MSGNGEGRKYKARLHLNMPFGEAVERFARTDPKELDQPSSDAGPVQLVEDADTGDRLLIYQGKGGVEVDLAVQSDTFWASQQQMADIFGVTRQNITMHLQNIFKDGELNESASSKETLRDGRSEPRKLYDLNALISVGYRVGGKSGTQFRVWATDKLLRYLTKGFVIDTERLKEPGNRDHIRELRDTIREIRASESNLYAELRSICAMCKDYNGSTREAHEFYSRMQAKLYWRVVSNTPAMVLKTRADATQDQMGLRTWKGIEGPTQADATTAKNYLSAHELRELNRLTGILLDIFEHQLDQGKLTLMSEAAELLDKNLRNLEHPVLRHGGSVKHVDAESHAKREYSKFDKRRRELKVERVQRELLALKSAAKEIPMIGGNLKRRRAKTGG